MKQFIASISLLFLTPLVVRGEQPHATFDVVETVSCEVVSGKKQSSTHKLVEVVFKISAAILGDEEDISELVYYVGDWQGWYPRNTVVDFLPRTKMYSDVAGTKTVILSSENSVSGDLSGVYNFVGPNGIGNATAKVGGSHTSTTTSQYEKLPPKELLVASGTIARARAVFYKIKPSPRTTLQGQRQYSMILKVPADWTHSVMLVRCQAEAKIAGLFWGTTKVFAGMSVFAVGLHLSGDAAARSTVTKLRTRSEASAQYVLGNKYFNGEGGVPMDRAVAAKWYRKAAEQGFAKAQNRLGFLYDLGLGVPENDVEAVKWYRKAAEQGFAKAQCNMGVIYDSGTGVSKDYAEAVKWFRKAVEQGDARAQYYLGSMYANGTGVPKDHAEAVKWYRMAAEQGYIDAIDTLKLLRGEK